MKVSKFSGFLIFSVALVCATIAYAVAVHYPTKDIKISDLSHYIRSYTPDPAIRSKRNELKKRALIKPVKVFQIGFSKCGTRTLFDFFNRNGVSAVHHDYGALPVSIYNNARAGEPLLSARYRHYWVFTDMERIYADPQINIPVSFFKELDKQYPGSKFILNTRDKQAWLKSRSAQTAGTANRGGESFLEITQKSLNKSEAEVLALWAKEWDDHHIAVIEYFKDRPDDLLVFNIEADPPEKLSTFFKDNFILDPQLYRHLNASVDPVKQKKREELGKRALIKPVKVFQIGFSKCGTSSLAKFFDDNGVASVHHHYGRLAATMYDNALVGKPLISPRYKDYWVYTDMEKLYGDPPISIGMQFFKELDKQYPGSKFILNTRNKQAWLKSRSAHTFIPYHPTTLLEINQKILKLSKEQVLDKWSKEWDEHHQAVIEYFKDRPNDLIVYNIDKDPPTKLVEFFKENFLLDPKLLLHTNKTSEVEPKKLVPPVTLYGVS